MGARFDPRHHEALAQLDVPGAEPGTVVAEHGRAFLLHGRLLRPALVAVSPPRPGPAPAAQASAADAPATPAGGEPADAAPQDD